MPALAQELFAPGMTVAQARRALTDAFRQAELDSPELDARLLVGHALGLDHTGLTIESARSLGDDAAHALTALAARRLEREPVARILGVKEFWGLPLRLNDATLVPRPETETVVEAALAAIDSAGPRSRALRIADLGTGSGALLLALLTELPNASGIGTDVSREALAAARDNADRLGLAARAEFAVCDFGAALTGALRPRGQQPALHCERRHRHAFSRGAARSAPRARWRRRWPRLLSHHCGTGAADCLSLTAIWWSSLASVRNRRLPRCSARRGLHPRRRAPIFRASRVRCMRVLPQ